MKYLSLERPLGLLSCAFILSACCMDPTPDPKGIDQALKSRYISLGKPVTVKLDWSPETLDLTVSGRKLPVKLKGNEVTFTVPKSVKGREVAWGGPRELKITEKNNTAKGILKILGNVITNADEPNTLMIVTTMNQRQVKEFVTKGDVPKPITPIQLEPLNKKSSGGEAHNNPGYQHRATAYCGGSLVVLRYKEGDYEDALTVLDERAENDDRILGINPVGTWVTSQMPRYVPMNAIVEVNAQQPHQSNIKGKGQVIAILDTGVSNQSRGEFEKRLLPGRQFTKTKQDSPDIQDDYVGILKDENGQKMPEGKSIYGHGTQVADLAAGKTSGIAPEALVMPIKICNSKGGCRTSDVLRGMCWALNTAKNNYSLDDLTINMSIGADTGEFEKHALRVMVKHALDLGVNVVASAGNQWADYLANKEQLGNYKPKSYPAALDFESLISVGAIRKVLKSEGETSYLEMSTYSNRGTYVDILAPGSRVKAIDAKGNVETDNRGTSFAAPQVAGAVALWKQLYPDATPLEIKKKILETANTTRVQLTSEDAQQVTNRLLDLGSLASIPGRPE